MALLTLYLPFVGGEGKESKELFCTNSGTPIRLQYLQLMDSTGFATFVCVFITLQRSVSNM